MTDGAATIENPAGGPSASEQLEQIHADLAERNSSHPLTQSQGDSTDSADDAAIGAGVDALLADVASDPTQANPGIPGVVTTISWALPPEMTIEEWVSAGVALGQMERAIGWWIGDWWNTGEQRYGERASILKDPRWSGPSYQTCKNAGLVCRKFERSRRRDVLSFTHHSEVCALSTAEADRLLDNFVGEIQAGGLPPPTRQVRQIVKADRRENRERSLGEKTRAANERLDTAKKYGVIYADPPWRFEPRSRETGMDRAADNHYPTMTLAEMAVMPVPAATDCVLFMWATVPMMPHALSLMTAWGFEYKSHLVWVKSSAGTGYWVRNKHELLLIGTRGDVPAPAPGDQPTSVMSPDDQGLEHSQKPDGFAYLIEELFPTLPRLEMFARATREGWDVHGNEADGTGDEAEE